MDADLMQKLEKLMEDKSVTPLLDAIEELKTEDIDKDLIKWAINSKKMTVVMTVADSINPKYLDNEIFNLALDTKDRWIIKPIVDNMDPSLINKDILNKYIDLGKSEILDVLANKIDKKLLDKEILYKALDTNNTKIVEAISKKIDDKFIDKDTLNYAFSVKHAAYSIVPIAKKIDSKYLEKTDLIRAINTRLPELTETIAKKLDKDLIDKEIFKLALDVNHSEILRIIASKIQTNNIDKELFNNVLKTSKTYLIKEISSKVDPSNIDKEMLIKAIESKNSITVEAIANRISPELIEKNMLIKAIKIKKPDIVKAIADNINQKYVDKDILNMAFETKDPKIVLSIAQNIEDRNILTESENEIYKALITPDQVVNLAEQVLNTNKNTSDNQIKQQLLLDIYLDVVKSKNEKNKLFSKEILTQFEETIKESKFGIFNPKSVSLDNINKKSQFLIMPINSRSHTMGAVIKNTNDDEKFNVYLINLGARPFEKVGNENNYKEYIMKKEDIIDLIREYSPIKYTARLEDIYKDFKEKSVEEFNIKIDSPRQRVGNCFVISVYKSLNFTLTSLISKEENKDFDISSLRSNVGQEMMDKKQAKTLRSIYRSNDERSGLSTEEFKKELVKALQKRYPECEKALQQKLEKYQYEKHKRQEASLSKSVSRDK